MSRVLLCFNYCSLANSKEREEYPFWVSYSRHQAQRVTSFLSDLKSWRKSPLEPMKSSIVLPSLWCPKTIKLAGLDGICEHRLLKATCIFLDSMTRLELVSSRSEETLFRIFFNVGSGA
jgi:hypothetical protein